MQKYSSLQELQDNLSRCRLCLEAGYQIESAPLFAGRASMRVMLIGQAPSENARRIGHIPFSVGTGGRRLFEWLHRAGWQEEDFRRVCYITSVTKCFPGKKENGKGDRMPKAAERKLCLPWLEGELAFVDPELVITLGTWAAKQFYPPKSKLNEIIGTSMTDVAGRHILPLPHPSGTSRWLNNPSNVGLLEIAIFKLRTLREDLEL